MATLFLVVIYLTFIGLGLPDSLLGSAWPVMRADFGMGLSAVSPVQMTISAGTVVSSLAAERLVKRFKTGPVTTVSVGMTALALLGFSLAPGYGWLVVLAVPLGLGAGAIDASLNNFVALHYKPRHMSWLHCFWGVGAMCSPLIMSANLAGSGGWRGGYRAVGLMLCVLAAVLVTVLPMWKKEAARARPLAPGAGHPGGNGPVLRIPGVVLAMLVFTLYCAAEGSCGMWAASFFVETRGLAPPIAARFASVFYVGITAGRLVTGFLTLKLSNVRLIRLGLVVLCAGVALMLLPLPGFYAPVGLVLAGLGCAPIFPCMLHETPVRFGAGRSQKIIGIQMASAYVGSVLGPPALGLVADAGLGIGVLPAALAVFAAGMLLCSERVNAVTAYSKE